MSSWKYDPRTHKIVHVPSENWEIDLAKVNGQDDLLYWLLQAAQHGFNIHELVDEFLVAINWCFPRNEINGAAALKDLFEVFPSNSGPVDWINGVVR